MEDLKTRILKGINYFRPIKPSRWNYTNTVHLKKFLDLVEKYLEGGKQIDLAEEAKKIFDVE